MAKKGVFFSTFIDTTALLPHLIRPKAVFFTLLPLFISLILLFVLTRSAAASPTTAEQAEKAVRGWLKTDDKPFGATIGKQIKSTDVYNGADGQVAYYIVYLNPSGFVIVCADDLVEPVVGFVAGDGFYDPSSKNPLGALVSRDLPNRICAVRNLQKKLDGGVQKKNLTAAEAILQDETVKAKDRWNRLLTAADSFFAPTGLGSISDVRVAPLVQSKWDQEVACGYTCYNYYTPNNYVCGCVATAMAQLMRYHLYPTSGIGVHAFTIYVDGSSETAYTRGGNGSGGSYSWSDMVLVPGCSITLAQRQAIGALCYDAGVSASMQYSAGGSGAFMDDAKDAMLYPFMYSNAVVGGDGWYNIGSGLNGMINPNLDGGYPVLLGINDGEIGHAIVADGYGYQSSTLYHHLNLGWSGSYDAWYNLPTIDAVRNFNSVDSCIYNVYTSGSGEIISGRVSYEGTGEPFAGATVTATGTGGPFSATTNDKGIYALAKVRSGTTYTISVSVPGYSFSPSSLAVTTGTSSNYAMTSGNKWDNNFTTSPQPPPAPDSISYPTSNGTGQYTVSWPASGGATSYQLERSADGGGTWSQVYSGSSTSYAESIGNGSYRYRVKATNSGGSSDWTTGDWDCVVYIVPTYCLASGSSCDEYIKSVVVGTINNSETGCSHYADYTAMSTIMETCQIYQITVTNGKTTYPSDRCGIWVDWNHDYDFGDAGETITVSGSPGVGPYTADIAVPADAALGSTRMRIRITYGEPVSSCGTASYGEVEDYTVDITEGYCPCTVQESDGFESGDFSALPWITYGNANWTVTSAEKYAGAYSAKAGTITHSQSTSLELTIDVESGNIAFYRKVSSESNYDWLRFYIDGIQKAQWSGTQNWTQFSYPIATGTRTFKWTYSKDGTASSGSDTAWIDDIAFPVPCDITVIVGDFDGDNDVDTDDLGIFCASWLTDDALTDIAPAPEGDGIVEMQDFAIFAQHWLEGTSP